MVCAKTSRAIWLALGLAALAVPVASPAGEMSGPQMLAAADRSFSAIPFGTKVPPPELVLIDDGGCASGECSYRDAKGVVHYFNEGELVVKSVSVADVGVAPIAALGIGTARQQGEVLAEVQRFLPQAEISCDPPSGATYDCGAMLGEGWFRLFFDRRQRLIEVRLDAYQFT
jgi:hypothetical protein